MQDAKNPLRDGPAIVLLDEMNLARVEYYFADLLSKLEARRGVDRYGGEDAEEKERASVAIDTGPGHKPEKLLLDERVLFVGTMNEDETTQSFSPKVIDRSCLLTFPRPGDMRVTEQQEITPSTTRLAWESWDEWRADRHDDEQTKTLNEVNHIMADLGHPFGHRLFRAISAYIANYPSQNKKDAWADQFAMKLIPRLKGLECQDERNRHRLTELARLVPEDLSEDFDDARKGEFFTWRGASKLYRAE